MRVGSLFSAGGSVVPSMFVLANHLQVLDAVVGSVAVTVVDVKAFGDGAVPTLPNVAMDKAPGAVGSTVVASVAQRVAMSVEYNEGQRLGPRSQCEASQLEHLVDALPRDAERFGYSRQAMAFLVQLEHRLRLIVLAQIRERTEAWTHIRIISMGVSGVNL